MISVLTPGLSDLAERQKKIKLQKCTDFVSPETICMEIGKTKKKEARGKNVRMFLLLIK